MPKQQNRIFQWRTFVPPGILLCLGVASCFKNEDFPIEPIIFEPEVTIMTDSAQVSFGFTDGDGDIGLADSEIDPPYDTSSKYHYNLIIEYFEKDNVNGWQSGLDLAGDTVFFEYRIHPFVVKGKNRGIKGTIDVMMADFYNPFSTDSDTIKYRIQLIDHALHESNLLETAPVIYPH